jgi:transcriptional regulator with XRE-family HTH domain
MKQPDLGRKISELRIAKGLTQGELAEKCNLSLRTIQRIESSEVTPRSYTVKLIFSSLEYDIYNSFGNLSYKLDRTVYRVQNWLEQFYKYVIDLFNLKTNTMKKISILAITILSVSFILFTVCSESKAQTPAKVKKIIEESNRNFIRWFNNGQIDSLLTLYRDDACVVAKGCGKAYILNHYKSESYRYKFKELNIISVSVSDSIAVEKGRWVINLNSGEAFEGEYLAEWRFSSKKWLMVNEISNSK